jgi:hypothetical protein
MSTSKKFTVAAIVVLFILPAVAMMWASLLLGANFSNHQVGAAVGLSFMGLTLIVPVIAFMD